MIRRILPLFVMASIPLLGRAQEQPPAEKPAAQPEPRRIRCGFRVGERLTGTNAISYRIETTVRQGQAETKSSESVQRTERFVDVVARAGENGVLEINRTYLKQYTKVRSSENDRPVTLQSPVQGCTVQIEEKRRRREVTMQGQAVDNFVRRTVGIEIDWRDIFPDEPVAPGDAAWEADSGALARRLAAYLDCGTHSKMRVRYEEDTVREGAKVAKLYIDWTIEGMRDKHLFTKVALAGDVYYDFALERVVSVDLVGTMIVRGAIVGEGAPRIVKGEGPVLFKSSLKPSPADLEASAD